MEKFELNTDTMSDSTKERLRREAVARLNKETLERQQERQEEIEEINE